MSRPNVTSTNHNVTLEAAIVQLASDGLSRGQIAALVGVSQNRVSHHLNGTPYVGSNVRQVSSVGDPIGCCDEWDFSWSKSRKNDAKASELLKRHRVQYRDVPPEVLAREERNYPLPFRAREIEPRLI